MSRAPKKRNKAYHPRPALPHAGMRLLVRASVEQSEVTDGDAGELELVALTALDAVTHGHGTRHEWDALARCLNQAWTLAHNGIGAEAIPALARAQDGMRRAVPRYEKTGVVGLDGDALRDVRAAIALWGDQLRMSTIGEVDAATRAVERQYWKQSERRAARVEAT